MRIETIQKVNLIGKKCIVNAIYINKPKWDILKIEDRPAWITGFGVIRRGKTDYDYDEGYTFSQTKTIKVVKVRFWPTSAENSIPLDAYVLDDTVMPFLFPPVV